MSYLYSPPARQISIEMELFLQLERLVASVSCSSPFSIRSSHIMANVQLPHPGEYLWSLTVVRCCSRGRHRFLLLRTTGGGGLCSFLGLGRDIGFICVRKMCAIAAGKIVAVGKSAVAGWCALIRWRRGTLQFQSIAGGTRQRIWRRERAARLSVPGLLTRILESARIISNCPEMAIVGTVYTEVYSIVVVTERPGMHAGGVPVRSVHSAVSTII